MLGVKVGMTKPQIQARLGPPDKVSTRTSEILGSYTEYRYGEVAVSLFTGAKGQAFNFFTRGALGPDGEGCRCRLAGVLREVGRARRGLQDRARRPALHGGQGAAGQDRPDFRIGKGRVSSVERRRG